MEEKEQIIHMDIPPTELSEPVVIITKARYQQMMSQIGRRDVCWFCGGKLCWDADFNYDEVFGEGEGVVANLHCMDCGAEVQCSVRSDAEDEGVQSV